MTLRQVEKMPSPQSSPAPPPIPSTNGEGE